MYSNSSLKYCGLHILSALKEFLSEEVREYEIKPNEISHI